MDVDVEVTVTVCSMCVSISDCLVICMSRLTAVGNGATRDWQYCSAACWPSETRALPQTSFAAGASAETERKTPAAIATTAMAEEGGQKIMAG